MTKKKAAKRTRKKIWSNIRVVIDMTVPTNMSEREFFYILNHIFDGDPYVDAGSIRPRIFYVEDWNCHQTRADGVQWKKGIKLEFLNEMRLARGLQPLKKRPA